MSKRNAKRDRETAARAGVEAATARDAGSPRALSSAWLRDGFRQLDWRVVALTLAVKFVLLVYAVQAYYVLSNKGLGTFYGYLEIWNRWDAPHYLDLARDGYVNTGEQRLWLVFYPLYPWLVRAFAFVVRNYMVAAFVVSAVASVAAGLLLHRLVRLDHDEPVARGAVWFMLIFPTAYFLHIGYTESLFIALAVGSFLAARREHWLVAGCLGALACLTRVNGLVLIPALAVEALGQYRQTRRYDARWLYIGIAAAGFGGYLLLNKHVAGDYFAFTKIASSHWHKTLTWPWVGIGEVWNSMWTRQPSEAALVGALELFFVVLGLVATVWSWLKLRPSYAVWMTGNWLLWSSTAFLLSTPRYTLIMFPLFILFARLATQHTLWNAVITVWSLLFLSLFAGQFVQGRWAF